MIDLKLFKDLNDVKSYMNKYRVGAMVIVSPAVATQDKSKFKGKVSKITNFKFTKVGDRLLNIEYELNNDKTNLFSDQDFVLAPEDLIKRDKNIKEKLKMDQKKREEIVENAKQFVKENIEVSPDNIAADGDKIYVKITNPDKYHEKYKNKEGYITSTHDSTLGKRYIVEFNDKNIPPVVVYNNEFEIDFGKNLREKEKKYMKDELKKSFPLIPVTKYNDPMNNTLYLYVNPEFRWPEDENYLVENKGDKFVNIVEENDYKQSLLDKYNYIFGNFFRTDSDDAQRNVNKMADHINKMVEKTKDWANIIRTQFKDNNVYTDEKGDLKIAPSVASILDSKFRKYDESYDKDPAQGYITYYKFKIFSANHSKTTDGHTPTFRFSISKVTIGSKDDDKMLAELCRDYCIGNFFLTKKEAKTSIIFRKLSTFFWYIDDAEAKDKLKFSIIEGCSASAYLSKFKDDKKENK